MGKQQKAVIEYMCIPAETNFMLTEFKVSEHSHQ